MFRALVALMLLFLLAPLIVVLLTSFSDDPILAFPPARWGFGAYRAVAGNEAFARGLRISVLLAGSATVISLVLGTAAALALARGRFAGRATLVAFFTAPLLLPAIVLGLGLLLVLAQIGLLATVPGLLIGHCLVTLPYVIRVVMTALGGIGPELEKAASTLGAAPFRVFLRVTLPLMLPGLVAAASLAFLASFDEVVLSLFLVGPRITTLPIEVYHAIQYRAAPEISALSMLLILLTGMLIVVVERSLGFLRAVGR